MLTAIRQWVIRTMMKSKGQTGVVQTIPKRDLVELNTQITAQKLMQNGIDPQSLKNADQVENAIIAIESRPKVQEGITSTKSAKVMDMEGKEIPPGAKIMGGKEVVDVEGIVKNITSMEPIEAMKEANKVIKREGKYKNLSQEDSKKILTDSEDWIFQRDPDDLYDYKNKRPFRDDPNFDPDDPDFDPENMAQGGRAGFKTGLGKRFLDLLKSKKPKFDEKRFREGPIDVDFLESIDKKDLAKFIRTRDASGPGGYGMYDDFADMPAGLRAAELVKTIKTKDGGINYKAAELFLGTKLKGNESADELIQILNRQEMRADGGRIGYYMGSANPKGLALLRELLNFFGKKSKVIKNPSDVLKITNPKTFNKMLEDAKGKIIPKEGIMATDAIKDYQTQMAKDRVDTVKEMLERGKRFKASDDKIINYRNEVKQKFMTDLNMSEKEAEQAADRMATLAMDMTKMEKTPKITDEGILQLENVLKNVETGNKKKRDLNADGGRAGFANGTGAPSIKYDFDNQQGPIGPMFETNDPKEAAKEIIKRFIPVEGAQIPLTEKGLLSLNLDNLDEQSVGGIVDLLGGELQFGVGKNKEGKGAGFTFRKQFKEGSGMTRRTFLKILGGAMSIPIIGKFIKPMKVGKKVANVPLIKTDNVPGKPEWFDQLVNKVIIEGDEVTKKFATGERQSIHQKTLDDGSVVRVTEDVDDGAVRVEYQSEKNVYGDDVMLQYKKPLPDENNPRPAAEFDVVESGPVGRADGPDDYSIDIDEVGGTSISDLSSDVSKLKEYATGKKPTMKEFIQNKKRRDKAAAISEGGEAEMDAVIRRQGEYIENDLVDLDPPDFAKGGIARMLGE